MPAAPENGVPGLAERLNKLFETIPQPRAEAGSTPKLYSNPAAANELLKEHNLSVTPIYISQLRKGTRNNPSARLLAAIADLFGVPLAYFFDDETAERVAEQIDILKAARDARVKKIMLRTTDLSDHGLDGLAAMLTTIRQYEGLGDDQDPSDD